MRLTCPIPEEQNTRGRRIHDPAHANQLFGMLLPRSASLPFRRPNQCWGSGSGSYVFGLPDPYPDPLVLGTDPALDPAMDPSIIKQK